MLDSDSANRRAWSRELRAHRLGYPDERLVALVAREFGASEGDGSKAGLDAGFGSGRHLQLLLEYGFRTHGIEVLPEAVEAAEADFKRDPLFVEAKVADLAEQPYPGATFDCIIAWGVVFLRTRDAMIRDLRAVRSMLTDSGRAFINFRTPHNWMYGLGRKVEAATFALDERAGPYEGMTYTFLDLPDVRALLGDAELDIASAERLDYWKDNARRQNSWWLISAKRSGSR